MTQSLLMRRCRCVAAGVGRPRRPVPVGQVELRVQGREGAARPADPRLHLPAARVRLDVPDRVRDARREAQRLGATATTGSRSRRPLQAPRHRARVLAEALAQGREVQPGRRRRATTNPEKWTYSAIEHLFDEMRDGQTDYRDLRPLGGRAVRAAHGCCFRPDNRASVDDGRQPRLVHDARVAQGEEREPPIPYSLVGSKSRRGAGAPGARASASCCCVGEKDNDPDDENLNKTRRRDEAGRDARGARRELLQGRDRASPASWA